MAFSRELLEEIRDRVSIEDVVSPVVTLKRGSGPGRLKGLCPFHQEDTPSFSVDINKGLFYCFGCTTGGDVFKFVMLSKGIRFAEAVTELGEMCGVEVKGVSEEEKRTMRKKADLYDVCKLAAEKFCSDLMTSPEAKEARDYLATRQMNDQTILNFQLGYAKDGFNSLMDYLHKNGVSPTQAVRAGLAKWKDAERPKRGAYSLFRNRIIIPIRDSKGRIVAFGGRKMPSDTAKNIPKYINSPETQIYKKSKLLYGLAKARPSFQKTGRALLVEGYFDVIALHQAGFKEAVATCGTALTSDHVQVLRPLVKSVVALFDSDEAGMRAAEKSYPIFIEAGIEVFNLDLGDSKDPDELIQRDGAEAFQSKLNSVESFFHLQLRRLIDRHGLTPGGKEQVIDDLGPLLKKMSIVSREAAIVTMSSRLGIVEAAIRTHIGKFGSTQSVYVPQPSRWRPTMLQTDLIWLLIHYNSIVTPLMEELDPSWVSSNRSLLFVLGLLMEGRSVAEAIEQIEDSSMRQIVLELAVKDGLYTPEDAEHGTLQIINRMKLSHLQRELLKQQQRISELKHEENLPDYLAALQILQDLRQDIEALDLTVRRGRPLGQHNQG